MYVNRTIGGGLICVVAWGLLPAHAADPAAKIDFNRDIRPILSETCFQCHGPDANQRKADLRLDTKDGLFRKIDDHATIVPGKLDESELFLRVSSTDPQEQMPPPKFGKPLSAAQIALIRDWIAQGAEWHGHWAYQPPQKSPVPTVEDPAFVRNEIDRFILAPLQERGLAHAQPADRVTLVRRLYFDLLGLPPSPEDVQAFVSDQSADAWEKQIDKVLASPHFGERMAQWWLDQVRFADTDGYHGDNHRDVDLYRDYVIDAFNSGMPFDRFTIEQLAGDLLPDRTTPQLVASGYNRMLMTTREGGAQAREYMAKYAADRVRNVSTVWLAGTLGCAECHDHKFDPFTTRDFYSLAAFFADIQEIPVGAQPQTPIPTAEQQQRMTALDGQIADLQRKLDTPTPETAAAKAKWEQAIKSREIAWTVLTPTEVKSKSGSELKVLEDGTVLAVGAGPAADSYTLSFRTNLSGITALRLEALPDDSLPMKGPGRAENGNFVLNEIEATANGAAISWNAATASFSQQGFPIEQAIDRNLKENTGWAVSGNEGKPAVAYFETRADLGGGEVQLTITLQQNYGKNHTLGKFRIAVTNAIRPVRHALPAEITALLALPPDQRNDAQKQQLTAFYRSVAPELIALRTEIDRLQADRAGVLAGSRTTLVSMSGNPREMRVLPRGNWLDESGTPVEPAVPGFLGKINASARASRLDLARWIVSAENPVTARVIVNRLWKIMFGQGLVKTLDDFGAQGAWPTHPALLDWLALELRDSGWNVRHVLKLMALSGAYQQSSHASEELRQRDPYNKWLARQGRFRLDAEFVRDNALAVSGLLVPKVGGPSAHPYQPAGYWAYLNFPTREWQNDAGDGLYRRGLYTYWCRTFPHPSLVAFDAPSREECTVERPRSNTPLQALALLNDPTYVEAARVFAARIVKQGGNTPASKLDYAFRQALSRPPRPAEAEVLLALYENHRQQYAADAESAKRLIHSGAAPTPEDIPPEELAAWTSVARAMFNLHEMISRN